MHSDKHTFKQISCSVWIRISIENRCMLKMMSYSSVISHCSFPLLNTESENIVIFQLHFALVSQMLFLVVTPMCYTFFCCFSIHIKCRNTKSFSHQSIKTYSQTKRNERRRRRSDTSNSGWTIKGKNRKTAENT